jgi:ureidoglycolate hydrolase
MKLEKITRESFSQYGWVIEYPRKPDENPEDNLFHVVLKETSLTGWRIACLLVRDRKIDRLEHHPRSFESFEPVCGRSILFASTSQVHEQIRCFLLDKPVILNKGIWHGIVTLDKESELKISENAFVECVYWPLGTALIPPVESRLASALDDPASAPDAPASPHDPQLASPNTESASSNTEPAAE